MQDFNWSTIKIQSAESKRLPVQHRSQNSKSEDRQLCLSLIYYVISTNMNCFFEDGFDLNVCKEISVKNMILIFIV